MSQQGNAGRTGMIACNTTEYLSGCEFFHNQTNTSQQTIFSGRMDLSLFRNGGYYEYDMFFVFLGYGMQF